MLEVVEEEEQEPQAMQTATGSFDDDSISDKPQNHDGKNLAT